MFAIDFEQAFLNAPVGIPDLYIKLPDLPFELRDKDCGPTRWTRSADGRPMVGRLNKSVYGLRDSPRAWNQFLTSKLASSSVGVSFTLADRNVFRFDCNGEILLGCIHVDDILFAPSSPSIRLEFCVGYGSSLLLRVVTRERPCFLGWNLSMIKRKGRSKCTKGISKDGC